MVRDDFKILSAVFIIIIIVDDGTPCGQLARGVEWRRSRGPSVMNARPKSTAMPFR